MRNKGFTLAELLIALAILGVIATFTIPKVLNSSTSSQNTAIAKEAASIISGAFSAYQLNNTLSSSSTAGVLTQFINYVRIDTTTTGHTAPGGGTALADCSATAPCILMHNGGIIQYSTAAHFAGADTTVAPTDAVIFNVDPDGNAGVGAVSFYQFANGRLSTGQHFGSASVTAGGLTAIATDPSYIANWN